MLLMCFRRKSPNDNGAYMLRIVCVGVMVQHIKCLVSSYLVPNCVLGIDFKVDSRIDGLSSSRVVPPDPLVAKNEAKAVLTLFLKKQGVSNDVAAETINKSDLFIDHLLSRLHFVHESWYLVGQVLTATEIRDALITSLEALLKENENNLVEVVENFTKSPAKLAAPFSPSRSAHDYKKLKAVSRVSEAELGMDLEQIRGMTHRFPSFAYYSLEGKIKPLVEFLLDLGLSKSDVQSILARRPQLCGISLKENLIPTMLFLENLGVDKRKWSTVLYRSPGILAYSKQKIETTVDFLHEVGLSAESIGKILTRYPNIVSYNVNLKLRPTAEYFCSLGVNVAVLLHQSPQTFGLSIEANLKPVTEFFFESGYSKKEVGAMISRFGGLYIYSLADNLKPKWEFFLSMDYPKEALIRFPQYFSYSLEGRIKPRYALVKDCGLKFGLNRMLALSNRDFEKALKKKMEKMI
ncbi:unnamed protein product [Dovyalis caffra]|uniref:Transcription termination factor MTERF5, chloroplastic n=1 Tax=Dovyalis caffra TaxID=77055 RepID=A0AAV1R5H2_9ROSI|nr:unnamed protein product [Dovyalis caffra]